MRALVAAAVLVIARSAVFLIWEEAAFDSDQAIFGLMARHIAEGRAAPVFIYGDRYMLAVQAWLAAPLFAIAGSSVAILKAPVVLVNVATAVLLVWILIRDARIAAVDRAGRILVLCADAAGDGQAACRDRRRQSRAVSLRVAPVAPARSADRLRSPLRIRLPAPGVHGVRRDRDHRDRVACRSPAERRSIEGDRACRDCVSRRLAGGPNRLPVLDAVWSRQRRVSVARWYWRRR